MEKLHDILSSKSGYLIRPYVKLSGKRNGYKWRSEYPGHWCTFVETLKKEYSRSDTGNFLKGIGVII